MAFRSRAANAGAFAKWNGAMPRAFEFPRPQDVAGRIGSVITPAFSRRAFSCPSRDVGGGFRGSQRAEEHETANPFVQSLVQHVLDRLERKADHVHVILLLQALVHVSRHRDAYLRADSFQVERNPIRSRRKHLDRQIVAGPAGRRPSLHELPPQGSRRSAEILDDQLVEPRSHRDFRASQHARLPGGGVQRSGWHAPTLPFAALRSCDIRVTQATPCGNPRPWRHSENPWGGGVGITP